MISRRKRPNPRTQYERDLRNGRRDWLHEPYMVGVIDWVRHKHNYNPYREGTDDHDEYERGFNRMVEEFVNEWKHANETTHDAARHGSPTT